VVEVAVLEVEPASVVVEAGTVVDTTLVAVVVLGGVPDPVTHPAMSRSDSRANRRRRTPIFKPFGEFE
jgi:hypothetical protein